MTDGNDIRIDPEQLEKSVSLALDEPAARLGEWQIKPLAGGLDPSNWLHHLSGQAHTPSGARPWSLVLKAIQFDEANPSSVQKIHDNKREAFFYQSRISDDLTGTFVAPRCYQVNQEGDLTLLWLEFVREDLPKPWTMEQYGEVARCLGRFNGAYLAGRPLPDEPWLARRLQRTYVELAAQNIQDLAELRKLPFFQSAFANMSDDFFLEAWGRRGEFLDALERLPQTYCHQDAFEGNLFWRNDPSGNGQLVGIDWSFTGIAAVGEELAALVIMATPVPAEDKMRLYEICLHGYLSGLAEAGYKADPLQVRFSSLTPIISRYLFGGILGEMWIDMRDERNHPWIAAKFGVPSVQYIFDWQAAHNPFYQGVYQEISRLLKEV
jgi:hypothetical protein